jgi:hypothetical protein
MLCYNVNIVIFEINLSTMSIRFKVYLAKKYMFSSVFCYGERESWALSDMDVGGFDGV